ncbi:Zn-dependent protease with chaperone function [Bacillus ectoiniformans]|uniref:M48 family metallopeptidase n=1 Tax=Bacillus ectoiniformans TaxID=1494429 RepID=UPI00195A893A|nr:M48 family metallopeptidase [Bacillus ectoiniformans]MBM7647588.1 Zn-dependent protease with chaperone function [Bacillus ectoiniformans]
MAKKWTFIAIVSYLLFGAFIYYYLFIFSSGSLPDLYKGTSADPETFLNANEQVLSGEYSRIRNLLFFLGAPFEWLVYFLILILGISRAFEKWSAQAVKYSFFQSAVYLFYLSLLTFVLAFPMQYISYHFSRKYQISSQTFSHWMKDEIIDFWISYAIMAFLIYGLYWLMKKFQKRWWLAAWAVFVPFTIFMMYIQPVFIDPLYNDFYPLKNKELETKILDLANEANIPANHVYEVNMSESTNALNAYVTGIGDHARIVLWDTTLNKLNDEEILFVMAHEMAHYVEKHIYFGIGSYLISAFIGFWLVAKLMNKFIGKYGETLKMNKVSQLRTLPLFLMLISMLAFASSPLSNMISRYEEMRADAYAIEMTADKKAAVQAFQKLAKEGLSEVHPPILVKVFRYGHPAMAERIHRMETYPITKKQE